MNHEEFLKKLNMTKSSSWVGENFGNHKKLVILGNGFDIDHKMDTKYSDIFDRPEVRESIAGFGKMKILIDLLDGLYGGVKEDLWSNFEERLGELIKIFRKGIKNRDFKSTNEKLSTDTEKYIKDMISMTENHQEFSHRDISFLLIHALIDYFKERKFINDHTDGRKKEVADLFKEADVLSYNYNTSHEIEAVLGKTKYFSRKDAIYIHGRIDSNTATDYDGVMQQRDSQIKLGVYEYESWTNEEGSQISKEWLKKHGRNVMEEVADSIGHHNNYFWKAETTLCDRSGIRIPIWEYIGLINEANDWDDIIFFGHSLSANDLDILKGYINLEGKNITIFTHMENGGTDDEIKAIKSIFPNSKLSIKNR